MNRPQHIHHSFHSRRVEVPGADIHCIDEGSGPPVLMVHGNPTSSFLFRHLICGLRDEYRCVAPDHAGFGRSSPLDDDPGNPRRHALHLRQLVRRLELQNVVLVAHDWGGPIGLSCALREPERISGCVLMNTWMWPVQPWTRPWLFSMLAEAVPDPVLSAVPGLPVRAGMPLFAGRRTRVPPAVLRRYAAPFRRRGHARPVAALARHIRRSGPWLRSLWQRRALLSSVSCLLLWGMDDPVFGERELARWEGLFDGARAVRLRGVGHFVPEEAPDTVTASVKNWLEGDGPNMR